MTADPTLDQLAGDLAEEHAQLGSLLVALPSIDSALEANERLGQLLDTLERHFAHEEQPGGLHDAIEERAPDLADHLDACFAQHSAILYQVRVLLTQAGGTSRSGLPALEHQIAKLAQMVQQHEDQEGTLLRSALASGPSELSCIVAP